MAGAERNANGQGTADAAHLQNTVYQQFHMAWNGAAGETTPWAIHGFDPDGHDSFPVPTDAVLSNGDGTVPNELKILDAKFEAAGFKSYVYNTLSAGGATNQQVNDGVPGSTFADLAATTDVQGQYWRQHRRRFRSR